MLLVVGLISAANGWMFTAAILVGSLVFFIMGVTRIVLRPKRGAATARRSGWLAAGSAGAWFAGTGDGGGGDGGSGGSCGGGSGCGGGGGAVAVAAAGVEPRMTGTWWRVQVPVVVTRCAPGRVPLSN
ncbi:hypothetical protein ACGFIX_08940 [Nocardia salmonicida]|uniref:hypothetical protein n=1 Tax=Nocardia salmonicida TaxID=53431 RepID=UPI00371A3D94